MILPKGNQEALGHLHTAPCRGQELQTPFITALPLTLHHLLHTNPRSVAFSTVS